MQVESLRLQKTQHQMGHFLLLFFLTREFFSETNCNHRFVKSVGVMLVAPTLAQKTHFHKRHPENVINKTDKLRSGPPSTNRVHRGRDIRCLIFAHSMTSWSSNNTRNSRRRRRGVGDVNCVTTGLAPHKKLTWRPGVSSTLSQRWRARRFTPTCASSCARTGGLNARRRVRRGGTEKADHRCASDSVL